MNLAAKLACWTALAQTAAAFQPTGLISAPTKSAVRLNAVDGDVPDIVKAYRKSAPSPIINTVPDIPPTTEIPVEPIAPPPVPETTTALKSSTNTDFLKNMLSQFDDAMKSSPEVVKKSLSTDAPEAVKNKLAYVDVTVKNNLNYADQFVQTAKNRYASTASMVVDSPRDPGSVPTLGKFLEGGFTKSTVTETMSVPATKVPTLSGYVQSAIASHPAPGGGAGSFNEQAAVAQEKFGLLIRNLYEMVGQPAPEISFSELSLPDGLESLSLDDKYVVGWGIAATAVLFAAGAKRSGQTDATMAMVEVVEKGSGTVAGLSKEAEAVLLGLQEEVKIIRAETSDLRKSLEEAQEKLLLKDVELSQERLRAADKELQLNREIQSLQLKLGQSETNAKSIEAAMDDTVAIRDELAEAVEKVKSLEAKRAEEAKAAAKASTGKAKKTATKKKATKGKQKAAVKKVRITKGAKGKAKASEKVPETKASAKVKKATKTKGSKAKTAATKDSKDWSLLSLSTLQRKTIKELQGYLDSKGISTTSDDGTPLKKASLVEAVQAA